MRVLVKLVATILLVTVMSSPRIASAQQRDPAAAEALFQKGRAAFAEADFELACQMFEESFALEPAVGTMMNLAACEEKRGSLSQSWECWHQAIDLLEQGDDRIGYAVMQMESIESRLGFLTIVLEKKTPPGSEVHRDEISLGAGSLGQELPVDPGVHEVIVKSPGHDPRRYEVSLESGEHKELIVAPGAVTAEAGVEQGVFSRTFRQRAGIAALSVGALGLGVAITTGAMLPAQDAKVEENCPGKVCNETGMQAVSGAKTLLTLNTIGWIATGVGAACGVTLLLTLPKKPSAGDNAQANQSGVSLDASSPGAPTLGVAILGTGVQVFGSF